MRDVISGCACFVCVLLRFSKKLFLRLWICVYVLLHDRLSSFNAQWVVSLCFPGMTSLLAKSKQIIGAHFQAFFYYILII